MFTLPVVHSSSRFDRSPASLLKAVRSYVEECDLLTLTETTRKARTDVLHKVPGFGLVKVKGVGGAGDPAILYREDRLTVEHVEMWKVADPAPRLKGVNIAGPLALFRDRPSGLLIAVVAFHYPAHLSDPAQMRVWREAVKETGRKVRDLRKRFPEIAHVIVNADWNYSVRDPHNEHAIEALLDAGLHSSWGEGKMPAGGTHAGRRVIDDTLTDAAVEHIALLRDDDSSDHRPYRVVLRLAGKPAPTSGGSMKFVSREDWGATARGATPSSHPIGATKGITAHWEGPGMGGFPHSLCARKVRTIQRFHKVTRGWADIAYNAIVCPHGYVFEGRGPNVKSAANGWEQVNDDWYAVCYLGGVGDNFTEAGQKGFLDAFAWLAKKGDAGPKRNGHRDHKQTACPGDEIYHWVHALRDGAVAGGVLGHTNEEDDMGWNDKYPAWGPQKNPDGDMPMDQQLQQARGYAQDAYRNARAANTRAERIEGAIKALAKALGPTVEDAVKAALAEAVVDVDVTVHQPDKE